MANSRQVLVTGGAGFVGSALAAKLLESGLGVTVVDDLSNGKRSNLPPKAEFIHADASDDAFYKALGHRRFDAIYHLAAQASNAISFRKPVEDIAANQTATLKLLEFARRTGCDRFIFTSSMSAYGQLHAFPTTEDAPLNPDSPYGAHKAASEHYLRCYAQEYGIKTTVFRLYTTYGSTQNLDNLDQGLLSIYLAYLVKKQPIVVKGALERKRDIVHVSDVVWALERVMDEARTFGQTYNMCTGTTLTIREILDGLISGMGQDPKTYPVQVLTPGTPGDPFVTHGSCDKAARDFGFAPKVSPTEGIRLTVTKLRMQY